MIQIIAGLKGSGKTKRLIDMTNITARDGEHDVIFLDDDNRYMYDVSHKVRFINLEDYHVKNEDMFIGFISGILSSNYDLGTVFIDAFLKLAHKSAEESSEILNILAALSAKHGVNFVLSVSADPAQLPEFMSQYLI